MEHGPVRDWALLPVPSLAHPWGGRCWCGGGSEDRQAHSCCKALCRQTGDELVASPQRHTRSTLHHPCSQAQGTGDKSGDTSDCESSFPQGCVGDSLELLSLAQTWAHRAQLHNIPPKEWLRLKHLNEPRSNSQCYPQHTKFRCSWGVLLRQKVCFYAHLQNWLAGHPAISSRELVSAWHNLITFLFPSVPPEPGSQQREQEFLNVPGLCHPLTVCWSCWHTNQEAAKGASPGGIMCSELPSPATGPGTDQLLRALHSKHELWPENRKMGQDTSKDKTNLEGRMWNSKRG